jgi:alpha-beta hydrolase superfamily lysophospholipase
MSTAAPMRSAPWTFAAPWGARGYVSDLDGPVHWIEFTPGDSPDGTPIVFVHGRQRQEHPNAAAFLAASRSLMKVVGQRRRYWEMMASVRVPVLLIGGEADRLVPAASMRQAAARNPRWETVMLPGVGHTPQLEVPDTVIGTVRDWLGRTTPGTR